MIVRASVAVIAVVLSFAAPAGADEESLTYRVQHKHFRGGCDGRLIVSPDAVTFESLSKASHSKRFELKEIKELVRNNPYEISVNPFLGDEYNFQLIGNGMSSGEYEGLSKRIASARAFGGSQNSAAEPSSEDRKVLRARHKHFRGGCDGTLILSDSGVTFESLTKATHSRQLQLSDIKELKRSNPYELTVKPFIGDDYDFQLSGSGLSSAEFQDVVDRVASSRAAR